MRSKIINMNPESSSFALQDPSFESLLDRTCSRLQDRQAQYSIKRLQELDRILEEMERELDILICIAAP